jgi:hypothetical protein
MKNTSFGVSRFAAIAVAAAALTLPLSVFAQESHEDAAAQTHYHDARHHTKAKIVGSSAVGGALVGAKVGGPGGALVGAGIGAGAGLGINHLHKKHEIHQREKYATPHDGYAAH